MNIKKLNFLYKSTVNTIKECSSCARLHVGAAIFKNERIVSTGYNGTSSGSVHCDDIFMVRDEDGEKTYWVNTEILKEFVKGQILITPYAMENGFYMVPYEEWANLHHRFSETNEIHAEMNAIAFAIRNKQDISGSTIVVSTAPCINCAKLIVASGIKTVQFVNEYDRSGEGYEYLVKNNIKIEKIMM